MSVMDYLTTDEASDYSGIPVKTLSNWRYLGTGPPYFKFGVNVKYRPDDLDRWIGAQRKEPHEVRKDRKNAASNGDQPTDRKQSRHALTESVPQDL